MKSASSNASSLTVLFVASLLWLSTQCSSQLSAQESGTANASAATQAENGSGVPATDAAVADIGTAPDQAAIDNLQKFLVGSKWKGTFTMRDREGMLEPEAYEIVSAQKEPSGDNWVLVARIKYMKRDVKVPVPLSIMWLDRTPVIVLDQITIPGMGTFDARVIIRKGMYAGTWAHGEKGGHMFGEITRAEKATESSDGDGEDKTSQAADSTDSK